jgi:hypothetical protein
MNLSKELWYALLFVTIGFTIWPLIIYYIGLTIEMNFFTTMPLRMWAEDIVYGPLGEWSARSFWSLLILFFPYLFFCSIRKLINLSHKT